MKTELVVVTGMSGSGKSVALRALEDAGYYCVDNLPPQLLRPLVVLQGELQDNRLAIAIDARSSRSPAQVLVLLDALSDEGVSVEQIFLDASDETLIRRFSETRRRHPLSSADVGHDRRALLQAIARERELLAELREHSHVIDTSQLRASQLRDYVGAFMAAPASQLTLVFESFGFKRGLSLDADYVFDVRMLPNPHYEPELRALSGLDAPVMRYLREQPEVMHMLEQISAFLETWLPGLVRNQRSYVTVAIGCTGGQHRSVFLVEQLARRFERHWSTLVRHRELDRQRSR